MDNNNDNKNKNNKIGITGAIILLMPTILIASIAIVFANKVSLIVGVVCTICIAFSYLIKLGWIYITHAVR